MTLRSVWVGLVTMALIAGSARAEPSGSNSDWDLPPEVPRPDFVRNRPFIPDLLLKDKREGRYVTGIPAVGWDAEEGFNIGAFVEFYDNGSRDDPFFRTAPYRQKIFVGGLATTEEVWRILGRFDQPYFRDTPYRIRADFLYERNPINNYHGLGGRSLDLISPRTGVDYTQYQNYQDDLNQFVAPGGASGSDSCPAGTLACHNSRYSRYGAEEVIAVLSLERDFVGGLVRPLLGFQIRHVNVDDYTGDFIERIDASGKGIQLPTQLFGDFAAGRIRSFGGGWDNALRFGLAYDSRDFEPNPSRGILAEMLLAVSAKALGSSQDYQRLTLSANAFHDFFSEREGVQQLILAGRAMYNMVFGDPPFYALSRLGFTDHDRRGVGGFGTLRGYKVQRFMGDSAILLNGEVRWFFTDWNFWSQNLRPGFAAFADTGRAWTDVDLSFAGWRVGAGGGFRLAWNLSTLVSLDVGVSPEDTVFYLELGTNF